MLRNFEASTFASFLDVGLNGTVNTLLLSGSLLYVGGAFTTVTDAAGTVTRNRAACLNLATARWTSWDPNAASAGTCYVSGMAISADGASMYLAGSFDHIGGVAHVNIAKVDIAVGAVSAWAPSGALSDVAVGVMAHPSNGRVYVGGQFKLVGATARHWFAAFDDATGTLDSWDPNMQGPVGGIYGLAPVLMADGNILIAGGFTFVGGLVTNRYYSAKVHPSTAANIGAWDSPLTYDNSGHTEATILALSGPTLIVGKSFGFMTANQVFVSDLTTGAIVGSWGLECSPDNGVEDTCSVKAIAWDPAGSGSDPYYVGGVFDHVLGTARTNLCAVDKTVGNPVAAWSTVSPNGAVNSLMFYRGKVIVAGAFTTIAGGSRNRLAILGTSGALY